MGVGAKRYWHAPVAGLRDPAPQQRRRLGFGEDLGLKVQPRRHTEERMRLPREAVRAPVLAPAVRIQRDVERDVGRVVPREHRPRLVDEDLRRRIWLRIVVVRDAIVPYGFHPPRLEAPRRVDRRAASLGWLRWPLHGRK